jgi:penicillin-binding protein 1A
LHNEFRPQLCTIIQKPCSIPSIVNDAGGTELFRFSIDQRDLILFEKIPQKIINAFIAIEDRQFFMHHGVSIKGIIRSLIMNLYHRKTVQGASTITQQLVRMNVLHNKKTLWRKIQEQWYAFLTERYYSKEQILEAYLNAVYFGCGIYGIQAACINFWSIEPHQISLAQAATLAGIVKSPNNFCPLRSIEHVIKRRNVVLDTMVQCQYISQEEYAQAIEEPLMIKSLHNNDDIAHIKEYLRQELEKKVGKKNLYTQGFVVQTTFNKAMQAQAHAAFIKQCQSLRTGVNAYIDGALISLDNQTGGIKALIGGFDFSKSQFNRAMYAKRQIGSTIKPLIYAAALSKGMDMYDIEIDEPLSINSGKEWTPSNYDKKFRGSISLAYALSHSNNIVTIKILQKLGISNLVNLLEQVEITTYIPPFLSLALGCIDAALVDVAKMFSIFACNGQQIKPYCIASIKDAKGNKIWQHEVEKRTIFPASVTDQIASILQHAYQKVYYQHLAVPAICKTGTTNDSRTCFFVGSTPSYTTAIYFGRDDNRPMGKNIFPAATAMPLWTAYNKAIVQPLKRFSHAPGLHFIFIHEKTGKLVNSDDPHAIKLLVNS